MSTDSGPAIRYPTFNYRDLGKFKSRDTLAVTFKAAYLSGGVGIFAAAVKASLGPPRAGLGGFLSQARIVPIYMGAGTAFAFTEAVSANLREEESGWNSFAGGAAAGAVVGATYRTIPKTIGGALAVGTILGLARWSGGFAQYDRAQAWEQSRGEPKDIEKGERQGFWDVVHRRPLSQTLDELGDLVRPFK